MNIWDSKCNYNLEVNSKDIEDFKAKKHYDGFG